MTAEKLGGRSLTKKTPVCLVPFEQAPLFFAVIPEKIQRELPFRPRISSVLQRASSEITARNSQQKQRKTAERRGKLLRKQQTELGDGSAHKDREKISYNHGSLIHAMASIFRPAFV